MKKCLMLLLLSVSLYSCSKEDDPFIVVVEHMPTGSVKSTSYQSRQCSGTTLKGLRCKNKTLSANGKCYLHGGK